MGDRSDTCIMECNLVEVYYMLHCSALWVIDPGGGFLLGASLVIKKVVGELCIGNRIIEVITRVITSMVMRERWGITVV